MIFLYEQSDKKSREERLREAGEFYLNKLGRSMPQAEDCWRVERTKRGKPFFPDQPGLQFSISHSGSVWACVMAEHPVGLDIQELTRLSHETEQEAAERYGRMAVRFFHEREAAYVKKDPGTRFFQIWAAKESYVKYTGRGIEADFSRFSVIPDETAAEETERKMKQKHTEQGELLFFREWSYPAGMSLCVCKEWPEEQEIWLRTEQELILKRTDRTELLEWSIKKTDKIYNKMK